MLPREPFLLGSFLRPSLAEVEIKCDEFYRLMAAIDSRYFFRRAFLYFRSRLDSSSREV
jgi:hypothetical protein